MPIKKKPILQTTLINAYELNSTLSNLFDDITTFIRGLYTDYEVTLSSEINTANLFDNFLYLYGDRVLNYKLSVSNSQVIFSNSDVTKVINRAKFFVIGMNSEKYKELARLQCSIAWNYNEKYNPLSNYWIDNQHTDTRTPNLSEKKTGTDTNTKTLNTTIEDELEYGKVDTRQISYGQSITDNGSVTHGKAVTHNTTTDNTTNSIFPYDSSTENNSNKSTHLETSTDTNSGTDRNTNSRTLGGTDTDTDRITGTDTNTKTSTGTVTDALQYNTTTQETGTDTRQGTFSTEGYKPFSGSANIQTAAKAERELADFSLIHTILEDLADYLLLPYWDNGSAYLTVN